MGCDSSKDFQEEVNNASSARSSLDGKLHQLEVRRRHRRGVDDPRNNTNTASSSSSAVVMPSPNEHHHLLSSSARRGRGSADDDEHGVRIGDRKDDQLRGGGGDDVVLTRSPVPSPSPSTSKKRQQQHVNSNITNTTPLQNQLPPYSSSVTSEEASSMGAAPSQVSSTRQFHGCESADNISFLNANSDVSVNFGFRSLEQSTGRSGGDRELSSDRGAGLLAEEPCEDQPASPSLNPLAAVPSASMAPKPHHFSNSSTAPQQQMWMPPANGFGYGDEDATTPPLEGNDSDGSTTTPIGQRHGDSPFGERVISTTSDLARVRRTSGSVGNTSTAGGGGGGHNASSVSLSVAASSEEGGVVGIVRHNAHTASVGGISVSLHSHSGGTATVDRSFGSYNESSGPANLHSPSSGPPAPQIRKKSPEHQLSPLTGFTAPPLSPETKDLVDTEPTTAPPPTFPLSKPPLPPSLESSSGSPASQEPSNKERKPPPIVVPGQEHFVSNTTSVGGGGSEFHCLLPYLPSVFVAVSSGDSGASSPTHTKNSAGSDHLSSGSAAATDLESSSPPHPLRRTNSSIIVATPGLHPQQAPTVLGVITSPTQGGTPSSFRSCASSLNHRKTTRTASGDGLHSSPSGGKAPTPKSIKHASLKLSLSDASGASTPTASMHAIPSSAATNAAIANVPTATLKNLMIQQQQQQSIGMTTHAQPPLSTASMQHSVSSGSSFPSPQGSPSPRSGGGVGRRSLSGERSGAPIQHSTKHPHHRRVSSTSSISPPGSNKSSCTSAATGPVSSVALSANPASLLLPVDNNHHHQHSNPLMPQFEDVGSEGGGGGSGEHPPNDNSTTVNFNGIIMKGNVQLTSNSSIFTIGSASSGTTVSTAPKSWNLLPNLTKDQPPSGSSSSPSSALCSPNTARPNGVCATTTIEVSGGGVGGGASPPSYANFPVPHRRSSKLSSPPPAANAVVGEAPLPLSAVGSGGTGTPTSTLHRTSSIDSSCLHALPQDQQMQLFTTLLLAHEQQQANGVSSTVAAGATVPIEATTSRGSMSSIGIAASQRRLKRHKSNSGKTVSTSPPQSVVARSVRFESVNDVVSLSIADDSFLGPASLDLYSFDDDNDEDDCTPSDATTPKSSGGSNVTPSTALISSATGGNQLNQQTSSQSSVHLVPQEEVASWFQYICTQKLDGWLKDDDDDGDDDDGGEMFHDDDDGEGASGGGDNAWFTDHASDNEQEDDCEDDEATLQQKKAERAERRERERQQRQQRRAARQEKNNRFRHEYNKAVAAPIKGALRQEVARLKEKQQRQHQLNHHSPNRQTQVKIVAEDSATTSQGSSHHTRHSHHSSQSSSLSAAGKGHHHPQQHGVRQTLGSITVSTGSAGSSTDNSTHVVVGGGAGGSVSGGGGVSPSSSMFSLDSIGAMNTEDLRAVMTVYN